MSLMSPTSYQTAPSRDIKLYITLLNAKKQKSRGYLLSSAGEYFPISSISIKILT